MRPGRRLMHLIIKTKQKKFLRFQKLCHLVFNWFLYEGNDLNSLSYFELVIYVTMGPGQHSYFFYNLSLILHFKVVFNQVIKFFILYLQSVLLNDLRQYCCCLLYTAPSPRDLSTSRMPSFAWKNVAVRRGAQC